MTLNDTSNICVTDGSNLSKMGVSSMMSQIDVEAALRDPAGWFAEPQDVVTHLQLAPGEKLAILRQWEQDAVRLSVAESEGMGGGTEAMLGRVERAIQAVTEKQQTQEEPHEHS